MVTRRFDEDEIFPPPPPSSPQPSIPSPTPHRPIQRPIRTKQQDTKRPRRKPRGAKQRKGVQAHVPRTLSQVLNDANDRVVAGNLSEYVPLPTGFTPLDAMIGDGLRSTELILLGGAQGIGKTICALQIARNIAMRGDHYAFYLSYEHTETHLMNRLLCLESINPPDADLSQGIKLKDLYKIVTAPPPRRAPTPMLGGNAGSLQTILQQDPRTAPALERMKRYADKLIFVKASPAVTTLDSIRQMITRLTEATGGKVVVFVDYLQKIAIHPLRAGDEAEKVTIIVEGLKDIALALGVPVFSIVAADREGLKSKRLHLFNLRGSSALDYECDIAIIMNNKYHILSKDHVAFNPYQAKQYRDWVVFTIEKNRAGRAMIDMEFRLHAPFFAFDQRGQQVQQQLIDDKIIEA